MKWLEFVVKLKEFLSALQVSNHSSCGLSVEEGFDLWSGWGHDIRQDGGTIFFIGNGASATMASHCAADLMKNARIRTHVFTDLSLITAVSNDISYEQVFSYPLSQHARKGDMLVAISSSGNSPNILRAVEIASQKGMRSVTISGMAEGNPLRKIGDLNFYLPAQSYGDVETSHAAILHYWIDILAADYAAVKTEAI